MRSHSAVGDTGGELLEALHDTLPKTSGKHAGLRGCVIGISPGLRADINDRALIHDDHTLAFIDHDRGTVCDDIVTAALVQEARFAVVMLALAYKDVILHFRAVKIIFPLISEYTAE